MFLRITTGPKALQLLTSRSQTTTSDVSSATDCDANLLISTVVASSTELFFSSTTCSFEHPQRVRTRHSSLQLCLASRRQHVCVYVDPGARVIGQIWTEVSTHESAVTCEKIKDVDHGWTPQSRHACQCDVIARDYYWLHTVASTCTCTWTVSVLQSHSTTWL